MSFGLFRLPKIKFGAFGDDILNGSSSRDILFGLTGDDTISSGAGDDTVFAGFGDDVIIGGSGSNDYNGQHGNDVVKYAGSISDYTIVEGRHSWQPVKVVRGDDAPEGAGTDKLTSVEALYFEADDYTYHLDGTNNVVLAGDDVVTLGEEGGLIDAAALLANDREFDGDAISVVSVDATSASGASVMLVDGVITYDPGSLFDALGEGETATDTFTYLVDDGKGGTDSATVTVTITGQNDAPVLMAPASVSYAENGTDVVVTLSATDVDSDTLTYAISGGADAVLFSIDATTGALSFIASPDFEAPADAGGDNIYDVEVTVSDGAASDTAAIAVTVTDVEEVPPLDARLNELHYDNDGADVGEFVEVRVEAGGDVSALSVVLYNGSNGASYGTLAVADGAMTSDGTWDYYVLTGTSLQNGSPDGLALVNGSDVVEFISYEGTLVAADGPAAGLQSSDMGVEETGTTPVGQSLWRDDAGDWQGPAEETAGRDNLSAPPLEARLNELHYDNDGADTGEFVEVRVAAGSDISALTVVLYNGSNGTSYATLAVADGAMSSDGTWDYYVLTGTSIQNGSPDGLALVNGTEVLEFFSYEGEMTATDGAASGLTSTDMGVSEPGDTAVGQSLWRDSAGDWQGPADETPGSDNASAPAFEARLNELHYDNEGGDEGEFVEVRVSAGADVTNLSVVLYNGSNGTSYATLAVGDGAMTSDGTYDYYVLTGTSIQNGSPDGLALVNDGLTLEFFSYEGAFAATNGPASGMTSTDMGVEELGDTPIGQSLWRDDAGEWQGPADATVGYDNEGSPPLVARLNELHYDNDGADVDEFVEVRVNAGADVSELSVVLYNGSNGAAYSTLAVAGSEMTSDGTYDYYVVTPSSIQNGGPDGVALVNGTDLVEFVSYEGSFAATDGPAIGVTSTDMGVEETSTTPVGQSLWRDDAGDWQGPSAATPGAENVPVVEPGEPILISEVQGEGRASALVGQTVTVQAIVVGDFQDGDGDETRNLGGFYLQELVGDGNDATSDGIFIFQGDLLADVQLGDLVQVTGTVSEYFGETQITASLVSVVTAGAVSDVNTLATHIDLDAIEVSPELDANGSYTADLEAYEGMLVTIDNVLTVNEMFQMDRFNEIRLTTGDQPTQYTQNNDPDVAGYDAYLQEIFSDQIVYDDGLNLENEAILAEADLNGDGVFDTSDGFTMGDTVTGLTGVLNYGWAGNSSSNSTWRVRSVEDGANEFVDDGVREETTPDVGGELRVVSFNVLNYFQTTVSDYRAELDTTLSGLEPRGAWDLSELERQTEKLVTTLHELDADVIGLVELENDFSETSDGNSIAYLVAELNATYTDGTIYDWVRPGSDMVGDDAIAVGMIYKTNSVQVVDGSVDYLTDADLDGLGFGSLLDDGQGVFEGSGTNRSPLTATFTDLATGEDFSTTVVHMKSKGSGSGSNADAGDGAGASNEMRVEGVSVVQAWLDQVADEDSLVLGDFNAYAAEDPIDTMASGGYVNLEESFNPGATTYVFDGQSGTLDYGFGSAEIMEHVTGAEAWHINSSEPDAIDYNEDYGRDPSYFDGDTPYRTSDHDPIVIGLDFDMVEVA